MPERSLGDWLRYLEGLHPVAIDLGLSRVRRVAQAMSLLPFPATVLTVAGTNGKGSVVYSSEAIIRAAGKRTGRYTSPHILSFNERIAVDGLAVDDASILAAFHAIEAARGDVTLTYFEFATLAALWVFREQKVEVAILEVGLGGRLDAVNIVDADIAVITSIALDHQHWLGDTVEEIAPEKAAVARAGRPVILAEPSYPATLFSKLAAIDAVTLRAGDQWSWTQKGDGGVFRKGDGGVFPDERGAEHGDGDTINIRLAGKHSAFSVPVPPGLRAANVAAAVQASARALGEDFDPALAKIALGDLSVPARRQRLFVAERELLLDVAHNPAAMQALLEYLHLHPLPGKTFAALGLMADKDLNSMAACLAEGVDGACALAIPGIDRAESPEVIWQALDQAGVAIPQGEFTAEAVWQQLLAGSEPGDRLLVCGSFHSVAGIMQYLELQLPTFPAQAVKSLG